MAFSRDSRQPVAVPPGAGEVCLGRVLEPPGDSEKGRPPISQTIRTLFQKSLLCAPSPRGRAASGQLAEWPHRTGASSQGLLLWLSTENRNRRDLSQAPGTSGCGVPTLPRGVARPGAPGQHGEGLSSEPGAVLSAASRKSRVSQRGRDSRPHIRHRAGLVAWCCAPSRSHWPRALSS